MATRFAGDYFGIPLVEKDENDSILAKYFPEIRTIKRKAIETQPAKDELGEARSFGDRKAAPTFSGFKTFLGEA